MGNSLLIGIAAVIILIAFAGMLGIIFFSSGDSTGRPTQRPASGRIRSEQRPCEPLRAVSVSGDFALVIRTAEQLTLTLTGDDDILPRVRTRVQDGVLLIDYDEAWTTSRLTPTQPLTVTLLLPALESLALAGDGRCEADALTGATLALNLSGTSHATLTDIDIDALSLDISGRSETTLTGRVQQQTLTVSGMAQVDAAKLRSHDAQVRVGGMSQITLWAVDSMSIHMDGSPRLQYYGDPTMETTKEGEGVILRLGDTP